MMPGNYKIGIRKTQNHNNNNFYYGRVQFSNEENPEITGSIYVNYDGYVEVPMCGVNYRANEEDKIYFLIKKDVSNPLGIEVVSVEKLFQNREYHGGIIGLNESERLMEFYHNGIESLFGKELLNYISEMNRISQKQNLVLKIFDESDNEYQIINEIKNLKL